MSSGQNIMGNEEIKINCQTSAIACHNFLKKWQQPFEFSRHFFSCWCGSCDGSTQLRINARPLRIQFVKIMPSFQGGRTLMNELMFLIMDIICSTIIVIILGIKKYYLLFLFPRPDLLSTKPQNWNEMGFQLKNSWNLWHNKCCNSWNQLENT